MKKAEGRWTKLLLSSIFFFFLLNCCYLVLVTNVENYVIICLVELKILCHPIHLSTTDSNL
jgi:hypothetical protein